MKSPPAPPWTGHGCVGHEVVPVGIVLLGRFEHRIDPTEIVEPGVARRGRVGGRFQIVVVELEGLAVVVGQPVPDGVAFARGVRAGSMESVLRQRDPRPRRAPDVVVETDEPAPRPERAVAGREEAVQLGPGPGVVQQIDRGDDVDGRRRRERRGIGADVAAAEGVPSFFRLREGDHLRRYIDAGHAGGAGSLELARIDAFAAGEVQHRPVPQVAQQLDQRVALDEVAEQQPLRFAVALGDDVVDLLAAHRTALGAFPPAPIRCRYGTVDVMAAIIRRSVRRATAAARGRTGHSSLSPVTRFVARQRGRLRRALAHADRAVMPSLGAQRGPHGPTARSSCERPVRTAA